MTDFCSIAIRIKEEDKNKVMKSTSSKGEKVKLNGDWLVVDCGFNDCAPLSGVIEDIGSALILNFNDYNKALDLILGGNIRYLDKYVEVRYDICEDMLNMTWDEVKPQVLNYGYDFNKLDNSGLVFFFENDEWAYTTTNFYEIESIKDTIYKGENDYSLASQLVNVLEKVDNVEEEMINTITYVMKFVKKVDFVVEANDYEILAPLYKAIKMSNDGNVVLVDRCGLEIDIEVIHSLNTLYAVCEYLDSFVNGDFDD